jgi:hypothetical protein
MAFQVIIGGVDFSAYVKQKSIVITERSNSERVSFKFLIEDAPFIPGVEQAVYIYESPLRRNPLPEAAGRVKRPAQKVIGLNGYAYEIEVGSWVRDIDRAILIPRTYTFTTTGFIVRDIMTFVNNFDASGVTTLGAVVPYFENRNVTPSQLIDNLAKLQGWNWWVDTNRSIHFDYPSNNPAPFVVNGANWQQIMEPLTFTCEPDTQNLINMLKMAYVGKYLDGTVNVSNGLTSVTGNGTLFMSKIKAGSSFQVYGNSNIIYTVQKVVNDQQFLISPAYNEPSLTATNYVVSNIQLTTQYVEAASVNLMAGLTGDNGIYPGQISPPAANLTFIEAQQYLKAKAQTSAYPVLNINFKSSSRLIPGQIFAGQAVQFNLTAFNLNTQLQITEIVKTSIGATDVNGYPIYSYTIKFETKLYALSSDLRLMQLLNTSTSDSGATGLDDITGVYGETPIILESGQGLATNIAAAPDSTVIAETIVTLDSSPNGPPYYWGNPGTTRTNADGSLTDTVTGNAVMRWGFFEFTVIPSPLITDDGTGSHILTLSGDRITANG